MTPSLAAAVLAAALTLTPAHLTHWLIKGQDLGPNGGPAAQAAGVNAIGVAAQAVKDGVTLPTFEWVGCGGLSDYTTCGPGGVPIFTSYAGLHTALANGLTGTALYDPETWSYTPRGEQ